MGGADFGPIVSGDYVAEMMRPRSHGPPGSMHYGLGLWIHPTSGALVLEGSDAGVSFQSLHDPVAQFDLHGLVEHHQQARGRSPDTSLNNWPTEKTPRCRRRHPGRAALAVLALVGELTYRHLALGVHRIAAPAVLMEKRNRPELVALTCYFRWELPGIETVQISLTCGDTEFQDGKPREMTRKDLRKRERC